MDNAWRALAVLTMLMGCSKGADDPIVIPRGSAGAGGKDAGSTDAADCHASDRKCNGNTPSHCDSKTGTWVTDTACPFQCTQGECTGSCAPNDKRCNGNVPQVCDSSGNWQDSSPCPAVCADGVCAQTCTDGSKQCSGNIPQVCTSSGSWADGAACSIACVAGACTGCSPGAKQCKGSVPQTCDANGNWLDGTACPGQCLAGTCPLGCTIGSHQCKGNIPQTCNAGGEWEDGTACTGDKPCQGGQCMNLIYPPVGRIAAGGSHTCALTVAGGVKCWGRNNHGQLGNGTITDSPIPVDVTGLMSGVQAVTVGYSHSCALLTQDGVIECWGSNLSGQLGNDSNTESHTPVKVSGFSGLLASAGTLIDAGDDHSCAVTSERKVKCWGDNAYGQLGDNTTNSALKPVNVIGLDVGAVAVSCGQSHTCALSAADGTVKCWGLNAQGQLGVGNTVDAHVPIDVMGITGSVLQVATGGLHSCALTLAGGVKCWGNNGRGAVGDGSTTNALTAVDVSGLSSGVTSVMGGGEYSCALVTNGGVKCWGNNAVGELGDGTTQDSHVPVDVSGLASGAGAIGPGSAHTCALIGSGGAKCWGNNRYGSLGNNTTTNSSTPVDVAGL
jgi:alpha-tubulin suppressor-like RCC1 family protein